MRLIYALVYLGCSPTWLLLGEGPMLRTADTSPTVEVRRKGGVTEYVIRIRE